jgi:hypothetical protein
MNETPTFQRISRETLEEHKQIHFYLDQIARTLEGLGPGMADSEPMRRLAAQIEGLKERLVEHHHAEEKDGLFQSILELLPDCRVEISRLVRQHEKMIEILEMARIHAQRGEPAEAEELRVDMTKFLEMFRQHELDEDQLLHRALERESKNVG